MALVRFSISSFSIHLVGFGLLVLFYAFGFYFLIDKKEVSRSERILIIINGLVLAIAVAAICSQTLEFPAATYEAVIMMIVPAFMLVLNKAILKDAGVKKQIAQRLVPAILILALLLIAGLFIPI